MATVNDTGGSPIFMGGNDMGFGGGGMGFWGFLILAMFLWGGNGWGGRGNGNGDACAIQAQAIQADVNRGFDNQNTQANQREILSAITGGTAQAVAATNQKFYDTVMVMNDKYSELVRDIGGVALAQERALAKQNECCCETLRAIDGVNYNAALNTASINANNTVLAQRILDAIHQNKAEAMQNRINQLELAQALCGVVRYPNATTFSAGANPFFANGCCNGCYGNAA